MQKIAPQATPQERPPATPARQQVTTNRVVGGVSIALGIFGVWVATMAFQYGLGTLTNPGVGAWPLIVGCALVAFSFWTLLKELKQPSTERFNYVRPMCLWVLVALAAISMNHISFIVSCSLTLIALFRFIGKQSWLKSIIAPVCITVAIYLIFSTLLSVPLP